MQLQQLTTGNTVDEGEEGKERKREKGREGNERKEAEVMTKKVRKSEKGRGIETTTTIAREVGVTGLSKEQGGRNEEFRWRKSRGGGISM